jgi:transcriptional accessory protein Tex/SPT6
VSFLFASVDVNNAGAKELSALSGVGAKKAIDIIALERQTDVLTLSMSWQKSKELVQKPLKKTEKTLLLVSAKSNNDGKVNMTTLHVAVKKNCGKVNSQYLTLL